ncbi:hypothetical protein JCM6882_004401 [Rhodosporidiobolus microsporus]
MLRRRAPHRSLHSTPLPARQPSKRSPPSPFASLSNPHSSSPSSSSSRRSPPPSARYNPRFPPSRPPRPPSSISLPALESKLASHLRNTWARRDRSLSPPLKQLADDLGVNHARLRSLAGEFAARAASGLSVSAGGKGRAHDDDAALFPTTTKKAATAAEEEASAPIPQFDLAALRTDYLSPPPPSPSPSALDDPLFAHTLRLFLSSLLTSPSSSSSAALSPAPRFRSPTPDPTLSKLLSLARLADGRFLALEGYPLARQQRRTIILHVGPTNSGKTHSALVALAKARTGAYAGPLRLLAHEVFSRFNEGKVAPSVGARTCNLVTGEEQRILDPDAGLQSCTVEMFPLSRRMDVGVIDEIQMLGDAQRGSAWTTAVVGALCDELHLCGEESVVDLVEEICRETGDTCVVKRYQRLSPLKVADSSLEGDLSRIRRGDCLVTFSRSNIFAFKRVVEEKTGLRVAVAYGGLPPEVREEQARAFNAGEYDVLVASDAVGMGLNLKIRRIVFESLHKWDGQSEIQLPVPQIKQIAGRAGRYGVHSAPVSPSAPDLDAPAPAPEKQPDQRQQQESPLGEATTLDASDLPLLVRALATPTIQVRTASLTAPPSSFLALSSLLAPHTPLSRIFALSRAITLTQAHYRPSGTDSLAATAEKVAHVAPLTFAERFTLASAPVNLRDAKVVEALQEWAGKVSVGEKVRVSEWAQREGVWDAVERVEEGAAERRRRAAAAAAGGEGEAAPAATAGGAAPAGGKSIFSPTALQSLESTHRSLTLYLWLSYRLQATFVDQPAARELRARVERAIEGCLEGIRFERVERRGGRKRNKSRAVAA